MNRNKQTLEGFQNNKKSVTNIKKTTLNLTSYTNDFPKNLKALTLMYMKAHNIISVTLDYKNEIAEYLERTPKQMWISLWLTDDLTTSQFKKEMQHNVQETSENLESFLRNVQEWFNERRFLSG